MSYTLSKTGAQIDAILNKADAAGIIQKSSATYAGVLAALALGSPVIIQDGADVYQYVGAIGPTLFFSQMSTINNYIPGAYLKGLALTSQDVWSSTTKSLQDKLTFDSTPTLNSTNPVTSDGIAKAISQAVDASYITDTAQGAIATFPDGADNVPVKSLIAQITPVQNLNGYDNPWPAGGGKNLLNDSTWTAATLNGVTFTPNRDANGNLLNITVSGTATANANYPLAAGFSYDADLIINGAPSGGNVLLNVQGLGSDTGSGLSFNGATARNILIIVPSGTTVSNVVVKPMIRLATESDPTFAPYSNICPISGWTGANITRAGRNLIDGDTVYASLMTESGIYIGTNVAFNNISFNIPSILIGKTLTFSVKFTAIASSITVMKTQATVGGVSINGNNRSASNLGVSSVTFTPTSTSDAVRLSYGSGAGQVTVTDVQLELGSTATAYEAYQADTIVLNFGQTVYAGTITALGGGLWKIQPTHAMALLEDLQWERFTNTSTNVTYFRALPNPRSVQYATVVCSAYPWAYGGSSSLSYDNMCSTSADNILIRADSYTTPEAFVAAMSGVQLLYELRVLPDPIIVSASDLQTLLGANTVWLDCGSVTGMTYRADTALYIDKKLGQ